MKLKSWPPTYAFLFLFKIFAFAFVYAGCMPEDFIHANLKYEKTTQNNKDKLAHHLQSAFRQTKQSGYEASIIARDTGLRGIFDKTKVSKITVNSDNYEIEAEVQVPALETHRNWTNV
jgi:hypothetical protein